MRAAVDELDAYIVGGHTEFTPGLNRPNGIDDGPRRSGKE